MKVLVDTSAWSLALRRQPGQIHRAASSLKILIEQGQDICITGCILQEVLQGFRKDAQLRRAMKLLEHVPLLPLQRSDHVAAARLRRRCASRGITGTTIDCQTAAAAIEHDCILLTADRDFEQIARISPLRLL